MAYPPPYGLDEQNLQQIYNTKEIIKIINS